MVYGMLLSNEQVGLHFFFFFFFCRIRGPGTSGGLANSPARGTTPSFSPSMQAGHTARTHARSPHATHSFIFHINADPPTPKQPQNTAKANQARTHSQARTPPQQPLGHHLQTVPPKRRENSHNQAHDQSNEARTQSLPRKKAAPRAYCRLACAEPGKKGHVGDIVLLCAHASWGHSTSLHFVAGTRVLPRISSTRPLSWFSSTSRTRCEQKQTTTLDNLHSWVLN
jgi:hypothetical protein